MSQHDGEHSYGYDAAGRVTSADHPGGQVDEAFTYDDLGNRTGAGEQYDAANRMQSRTGYTYLSDKEGRITDRIASGGAATHFTWDAQNRLRTITLPDGSVTRLSYDPMGRRVATTRGGQTRVQVYGLDPNAVAESSGSAWTRYTFGLGYDTPLAMTAGSASTYFEQDALSSVTSLSDDSGAVAGRYAYDTYGQITGHTGAASPYTYTGREYDPGSGLYDYRARWYEPATGRFTSQDPLPAANLYPYVDGNPVGQKDATGASSLVEELASESLGNYILKGAAIGGLTQGTVSGVAALACGASALNVAKAAVGGAIQGAAIGAVTGGVFGGAIKLLLHGELLSGATVPFAGLVGSGASLFSLFIDKLILDDLDSDPTISEIVGALGAAPVSTAGKTVLDAIFARNATTGAAVETRCEPYR